MAVAYSQERKQYGRAIGSFQALQHLLAEHQLPARDGMVGNPVCRGRRRRRSRRTPARRGSVAKAHAARAPVRFTEAARVQVFGGYRVHWEHDVHLLARRALAAERRFGDELHHERVLSKRLAGSRHVSCESTPTRREVPT